MSDSSRVRVSIVGVVIVALFSALLARLWFLQMGVDEEVKVEAVSRSTRVVQTEMPRGRILDRNGKVLVENRTTWAITVDRTLDDETRDRVLGQLSEVLRVPAEQLEENFDDVRQSPLKPAIVAVGVEEPHRIAVVEHIEDYPGVSVEKLTVRDYPNGRLAAHVLGYVGEISAEQLETRRDDGYQEGDTIGRAGAERAFERWLRGEPRQERLEVDPRGTPVGPAEVVEPGRVGHDVKLTIDADWQAAAEVALAEGIEAARKVQNRDVEDRYETFAAPAGSVVVLDVRDGSVAAMASFPSYDPVRFVDGISQTEWSALNDDPAAHQPLVNRATQGQYAPGSTFKLVTSVAMARYGIRGPDEWIRDNGSIRLGADERLYRNAGSRALGPVNLRLALTKSSDVYYYTAGDAFWQIWNSGDVERGRGLERTALEFGFGEKTGIELDEAAGVVPNPEWKQQLANEIWPTDDLRREHGEWYPADDIFTAIGQGGTSVTPLQIANAYAAFANGGALWRPHLAREVLDADGEVVSTAQAEQIRRIEFDPYVRAQMLEGFAGVTASESGTAYGAFVGFPLDVVPVAGKTGTAQVQGKGDTSLFAAYFPANAPEYVVVAVVEEAGQGAAVAAPIVRRVIEAMTGIATDRPIEVFRGAHD